MEPKKTTAFWLAPLLLAAAIAPRPVAAQDEPEDMALELALAVGSGLATAAELEFNFSNPGARSLAMGGAFVGRADDASAAYANPAGLVELTEPEVSVEIRNWTYTAKLGLPSVVDEGGFVPAGEGDLKTDGILFASYVYPRDRWTVATYRFALAGYDLRNPQGGTLKTDVVTYGVAGAFRFDNGLSLGVVLVRNELSVEMGAPSPFESLRSRVDDSTIVGNVGLLWRPNDRWSFGAVYREGPEFSLTSSPALAELLADQGVFFNFKVPDVAGIGFGWRPTSRLVLNADLVRVSYSQTQEATGLGGIENLLLDRSFGRFTFEDADEVHFGMEYSFWNAKGAPAIRFGTWWDPAHKVRFLGGDDLDDTEFLPGVSEASIARALEERFDGGEDRLHVSAGFGVVIGRRFQLDAAVDVSDQTESVSVSTLVRF